MCFEKPRNENTNATIIFTCRIWFILIFFNENVKKVRIAKIARLNSFVE